MGERAEHTRRARHRGDVTRGGDEKLEAARVSRVLRISRDLCIRDDSQSIVRALYVDDTFQNVCVEVTYSSAKYLLDISPLTGREGLKSDDVDI